jgi:hypothetical protein
MNGLADSTSSTFRFRASVIVRKRPCHRGDIFKSLKVKGEHLVNSCPANKKPLPAGRLGPLLTKDSQVFPQFLWKTIWLIVR